MGAETTLTTNLAAEASRAQSAETTLTNNLATTNATGRCRGHPAGNVQREMPRGTMGCTAPCKQQRVIRRLHVAFIEHEPDPIPRSPGCICHPGVGDAVRVGQGRERRPDDRLE